MRRWIDFTYSPRIDEWDDKYSIGIDIGYHRNGLSDYKIMIYLGLIVGSLYIGLIRVDGEDND